MVTNRSNSSKHPRRRIICQLFPGLSLCLAISALPIVSGQARPEPAKSHTSIPGAVMLLIVRAEDERRWDSDLQTLLADTSAEIRQRAALAAGRIGDERAVASLIPLLEKDSDQNVRAMSAFALGEIESATAGDALLATRSHP